VAGINAGAKAAAAASALAWRKSENHNNNGVKAKAKQHGVSNGVMKAPGVAGMASKHQQWRQK